MSKIKKDIKDVIDLGELNDDDELHLHILKNGEVWVRHLMLGEVNYYPMNFNFSIDGVEFLKDLTDSTVRYCKKKLKNSITTTMSISRDNDYNVEICLYYTVSGDKIHVWFKRDDEELCDRLSLNIALSDWYSILDQMKLTYKSIEEDLS